MNKETNSNRAVFKGTTLVFGTIAFGIGKAEKRKRFYEFTN